MTQSPGPVVVGFDGSEQARDALALGRLLADAGGAGLVLARVFPVEPWHAREAEEELAKELDAVAESEGAKAEAVPARSAARGLHEIAEELHASAIVVGSSHRGAAGRVLVGSTGERLLHGAPCAVAVAPLGTAGDDDPGLRVIAMAYDGSPESKVALARASDLAVRSGATMRIYTVVPAGAAGDRHANEYFRERLADARRLAPAEVRAAADLLHGDPAGELTGEAEKGVDLMVLGSRGYGPLGRVLVGGVSLAMVRIAPCPLLITPRGVSAPDG
jgi:nucleotide-binding universal stress UspA family protein